jgi:hypothetical protein
MHGAPQRALVVCRFIFVQTPACKRLSDRTAGLETPLTNQQCPAVSNCQHPPQTALCRMPTRATIPHRTVPYCQLCAAQAVQPSGDGSGNIFLATPSQSAATSPPSSGAFATAQRSSRLGADQNHRLSPVVPDTPKKSRPWSGDIIQMTSAPIPRNPFYPYLQPPTQRASEASVRVQSTCPRDLDP